MKYIRTEDEIYEIDNDKYSIVELNGHELLHIKVDEFGLIKREYIIKQADTIEELCDFFVVVKEKSKPYIIEEALDMSDIWYEAADRTQKVYGSILTENGITFVTKPLDCEKGECELL